MTEWRLDKAQQNGAFLRKWPQKLVGWSRKPGSIPCKPRFPRAGWLSTEAKKDQRGPRRVTATPRPPWSHPQAIWWPTGRHPEATLRLRRGYPEATPRLPRGYREGLVQGGKN